MIFNDNWLYILDYIGTEHYLLISINKLFQKRYLSKFDKITNVKHCIYNSKILKFVRRANCPWNNNTALSIVKKNDLDLLHWFYKESITMFNKCMWDKRSILFAGSNGYVDILEYLINNGCNCNTRELYRTAFSNKQYDIIQWCIDNGYYCKLTLDYI
jgi:hypothetical protein